ncbi:MAG TPA: hypothetical protein VG245_01410 [Candidatus Dormibacteraeota bacterium]|jgi:hypothetical protein|nr:hypothetical protein [Candidatus Dormibacteraeota bacterium]
MVALHLALFWLLGVAVVAWVGAGSLPGGAGSPAGGLTELAGRAVAMVAIGAALVGLLLLATGHQPKDGLHLMYGAVAVLVVPAAAGYTRRRPALAGLHRLIAALILAGIMFRLYATA